MANLDFLKFNAANVAPQTAFDVLPAGDYIAQITESSIKPTKANTGMALNMTWTVLDGQYHGRKIFDRINIQNQNPEAEKIGQSQLSSICHAVGVLNLQDSNQLHGRPAKLKVKIRKDDQWGDSNEVKGYSAVSGASAPAAAPMFAPQQPAAQTSPTLSTPPWLNKGAA